MDATTLQGQANDVNEALDLPHGALRAVQVDRFAHGYRITGPGFTTNSGMDENQAAAFLAGMLAAIEAGTVRDNGERVDLAYVNRRGGTNA